MWPFKKSQRMSVDERAGLAATFFLDSLEDITAEVMTGAVGEDWEETTASEMFKPVAHEVLLFQLHLADRLTRVKARGKNGGRELMTALLPMLADQIGDERSRRNFQDRYNMRQTFYGECREFTPSDGKPAGGTLFWEFAKIVLATAKQDPEITKMIGVTGRCGDILKGIDYAFTRLEVYG